MADRLRPLWDFGDLNVSEERFRAQLDRESTGAGRAEVLTQLARVEGLRGDSEKCAVLLDEAEALGGAEVRVLLERGRRIRSAGLPGAGQAQFEQAYDLARARGDDVLAVDAAHMVAIVDDMEAWTARGVDIAASPDDPGVRYWLGPLYNNVGWSRYEAGDTAGALEAFERALASRERDDPRPEALAFARYGLGKALRAAGRAEEAAAMLERCVSLEDADFHEELAEDYAALGRADEAREQAERALALIPADGDAARITRLREPAAAGA